MDSEEPLSLDDIQDTLDAEGTIPESWVGNREVIYPAVRIITSYDERVANRSLNAGTGGDYTLFMEALTDMLCAARPMTLAGERVSAYDVRDHLERFLRKSDFYFGDGTLYLNEVDEVAIEAYAAACESKPIKNPLGYMKACIWTALKTGDAATRASVSYDAKNRS